MKPSAAGRAAVASVAPRSDTLALDHTEPVAVGTMRASRSPRRGRARGTPPPSAGVRPCRRACSRRSPRAPRLASDPSMRGRVDALRRSAACRAAAWPRGRCAGSPSPARRPSRGSRASADRRRRPRGTSSKKLPPTPSQRSPSLARGDLPRARSATCGWSNTIPRRSGFACRMPIRSAPLPPPTSTIVSKREKS